MIFILTFVEDLYTSKINGLMEWNVEIDMKNVCQLIISLSMLEMYFTCRSEALFSDFVCLNFYEWSVYTPMNTTSTDDLHI